MTSWTGEKRYTAVSHVKALLVCLSAACRLEHEIRHCEVPTEQQQSNRYGDLLYESLSSARLRPCLDVIAKPGVFVLQLK